MINLIKLLDNGCVLFDVKGDNSSEIYKNAIKQMDLPSEIDKHTILASLCEREELMSTAVGQGIALPHSRNPIIKDEKDERICVVYPAHPINMNALDGNPIYVMFIILTHSLKCHLHTLGLFSTIFRDNDFRATLKKKPQKAQLVQAMQAAITKVEENAKARSEYEKVQV